MLSSSLHSTAIRASCYNHSRLSVEKEKAMAEVATIPKTHSPRFPNESKEYRQARERLLEAERELRDHVEEVAALRRKLPLGGGGKEDDVFKERANNDTVRN